MTLAALFAILWFQTDDPKYKDSFVKSAEATYAGSEVKGYVDTATVHARKEYPVLTAVAPMAYAIGIRQQFQATTSKYTPVPGTVTSYRYDYRGKSASVSFMWRLP